MNEKTITIGNRIPQSFYVVSGVGESDITIHAGSYHLALKQAGIEQCNIMTYSSILPAIAKEIPKPQSQIHGEVMETISAVSHAPTGCIATAAIIFGWLYDKKTGEKYGGLVCEYGGNAEDGFKDEEHAKTSLQNSLQELYKNGFEEDYDLKEIRLISRSFIPEKRFGTALVAICFVDYLVPIIKG